MQPEHMLTDDERAALCEAERCGWHRRSGRRLAVLLAWRERCRRHGTAAVVIIDGARVSKIEVDGEPAWSGPCDQAEAAAAAIAAQARVRKGPQKSHSSTLRGSRAPGGAVAPPNATATIQEAFRW